MMGMDVLREALEVAYHTLVYTFSYGFALGWAFLLSALFQVFLEQGKARRALGRAASPLKMAGREALLGMLGTPERKAIGENISRLAASGDTIWTLPLYLIASCNLTIYSWLLLGPLLGKEFAAINFLSAILLGVGVTPVWRLLGKTGKRSETKRDSEENGDAPVRTAPLVAGFVVALAREAARVGPWLVWGSLCGGLIAVWGLSSVWVDPALIAGPKTWLSQFINALMGLAAAQLTLSSPVANLFIATYLWKAGLTLSGFIAYLYGSLLSPVFWPAYTKSLGIKRTLIFVGVLAAGIIITALGVTGFWKMAGLTIRYKLSSNQLL